MATIRRFDFATNSLSNAEFDESIFGDRSRRRCLRAAALMYAANRRQGNAATLERSFVSGSTRKPWKQKHTGRARAGSKKSPLWRGGGTIFGPHPRDYSYARPQQELRVALRGALHGKIVDGEVALVGNLKLDKPSSKSARAMFRAFGKEVGETSTCLFVLGDPSPAAWQSMRNFPRVSVKTVSDFNADDILRNRLVLVADEAMEKLRGGLRGIAIAASAPAPAPAPAPEKKKKTTTTAKAKPKAKVG